QGLRVHNPQASTSSITTIARGNHPKSTSLIVPTGGLPSTLEVPPRSSMTAEMNRRMAMIVVPSGRLRVLRKICCCIMFLPSLKDKLYSDKAYQLLFVFNSTLLFRESFHRGHQRGRVLRESNACFCDECL